MKIFATYTLLLGIIFFIYPQKKFNILKIKEIKKHIELQKNLETEEYEPKNPYNYDEKDLYLGFKIIYEGLVNNGFKSISNHLFNNKMEKIFNYKRKNGDSCSHNWYYKNDNNYNYILYGFSYKLDNEIITFEDNKFGAFINVGNYFFNKDLHFITTIPYLNDIIKINPDNTYKITLSQEIIHRNKYLFNDNKASFPWLIANDEFFMESLVKTFGYTEDERLLEWVVNRTLNSTEDEEYNKIFFTKDCQGNFILHKNTFSLIQKKISEKYLESIIYNYLKKIDANKDLQSLNFEQKAEVLAYILYTGEAAAQKKFPHFLFKFMGPFYEFSKEREQYNQEFKRKNYYNLPNFKEYWEQAMIDGDGIGIPM